MDAGNYPCATQPARETAIPQAMMRVGKDIEALDALAANIERKVAFVSMPKSPKLNAKEPCAPQPIQPPMVIQLDGFHERLQMLLTRLQDQHDRIELPSQSDR